MFCTNKVVYQGKVWEYVYLETDTTIPEPDREHFAWNVIDMNFKEQDTRKLKGEKYEGRVKKGKFTGFGTFYGQQFLADIETDRGKSKLSLILLDRFDASQN